MKIPSVTQVLREVGLSPAYNLVNGRGDGRVALKAKLGLAVDHMPKPGLNLDGWKIPKGPAGDYGRSLLRWFQDSGAAIVTSQAEYSTSLKGRDYITHPDLELMWRNSFWTVEVKCTAELVPAYGVQLAAQVLASPRAMLACRGAGRHAKRGVLWVGPSKAKLLAEPPIVNPTDFDSWSSALQLWYAGFRPGLRR
jgi:hypothetical protein